MGCMGSVLGSVSLYSYSTVGLRTMTRSELIFFFFGIGTIGAKTAKNNLTCVFCRAKWVLAGGASGSGGGAAAAGGGRRTAEGYLNLGAVAGLSPVRDTSTCTFFFYPPSSWSIELKVFWI